MTTARIPLRPPRRLLAALAVAALVACGVSACSSPASPPAAGGSTSTGAGLAPVAAAPASASAAPPVSVTALLDPSTKYLGVAPVGAPDSDSGVNAFAAASGKKPDVVEWYTNWGQPFDVSAARSTYANGAVPLVSWQPFAPTLAQLAAGVSDNYIASWAQAIRLADVPVALDFGHEMNGYWYPWGTKSTTPAQFVAAWRHIHDIFVRQGATNVIWVWSPNVLNPVPDVPLDSLYPGDAYVDWIGMDGYYTPASTPTFAALFEPTMRQIRTFTQKPFFITETAVEPSTSDVPAAVADLFSAVASHADVIGFVWFDYGTSQGKRADWTLESDSSAAAEYRTKAASSRFDLDVRAAIAGAPAGPSGVASSGVASPSG